MTDREAFEKWAESEGYLTRLRINENDRGQELWINPDSGNDLWEAWQASRTTSEDEINRLKKMVYVPGLWKCPKCNCQIVSNFINTNSGNISANDAHQKCPNGCGNMWKVSALDEYNKIIDDWEKKLIELEKPLWTRVEDGLPDNNHTILWLYGDEVYIGHYDDGYVGVSNIKGIILERKRSISLGTHWCYAKDLLPGSVI
jgi:hypothetical protein